MLLRNSVPEDGGDSGGKNTAGGKTAPRWHVRGNAVLFLSVFVIVSAGFIAYGNSIAGEFVWDDEFLVEGNRYITSWKYVPGIFTEDIGAGSGRQFNYYRPVQTLTYLADYSVWKLNPHGYHLTNVILHVLAALVLWHLIRVLFQKPLLSLYAAVLFVIHPVHTEAVAYVSGRSDSLALIFLSLAFAFYVKAVRRDKAAFIIYAAGAFILALLSRENTLILPVLLLIFHRVFKEPLKRKQFIPMVAVAAFYVFFRAAVLKTRVTYLPEAGTFTERLPGVFAALFNYLRILILPFHLHMEYGNLFFRFTDYRVLAGIGIFLFLVGWAVKTRNAQKTSFFSISFFLAALLPVLNLYPLAAYMAEHWLYIPSAGFFLILSGWLMGRRRKRAVNTVLFLAAALLAVFYSVLTIKQNHYWREPLIFYERTLKYVPGSARMHNNLALIYNKNGEREKAVASCQRAIELNPGFAAAYYNLGIIYTDAGRKDDAAAAYEKAVEIRPDFVEAYNNLGNLHRDAGDNEAALRFYEKALEMKPDFARAYNNLGTLYGKMGRGGEAIKMIEKAIRINPAYAEAYNNMGNAYNELGRKEEAIYWYKKAIEIDNDYSTSYNNLAVTYFSQKQYNLALKYYQRALELGYDVHPGFQRLMERYKESGLTGTGKNGNENAEVR